ncbi:MAG TPA: glutamate-5-semialdehyde dehydrogenase [Woeseiaceae bacterium]|nr:glutamate-5-semialdehyde dehydrogenase [Woeseiaceae bacterium]
MDTDLAADMEALGQAARAAAASLAATGAEVRDAALRMASRAIREHTDAILEANARDLANATARQLTHAMLDRLRLDADRVAAISDGLQAIASLPDPLNRVLSEWQRPNGLNIRRVSVPLGVIGIIYESRPNVTADAAGLCLKAGNAVILRGGSESFASSRAIHQALTAGIERAGLNAAAVQMVPTTDRAAVGYLLSSMAHVIDVVVPRGGKSLIRRVQQEARVPVIGHLDGICHVYLHESAATRMACDIALNAKMRRTGICGAAETILVDRAAAERLVPPVVAALASAGCEVRADEAGRALAPAAVAATDADWSTEYLDAIVSLRVVDGLQAAIAHIGQYGSGHTECIVTDDEAAAQRFFGAVDSAILLHNASTQFADGGEFGMGAEIGIATGRLHARGPVGAEQLTSYKYLVRGNGQLRP